MKKSEREEEGGLPHIFFFFFKNPLVFPLFLHACVIGLVHVSACCPGGVLVLRQSCTHYYLFAFISRSSRRVEGRNRSLAISGISKMSVLHSSPGASVQQGSYWGWRGSD